MIAKRISGAQGARGLAALAALLLGLALGAGTARAQAAKLAEDPPPPPGAASDAPATGGGATGSSPAAPEATPADTPGRTVAPTTDSGKPDIMRRRDPASDPSAKDDPNKPKLHRPGDPDEERASVAPVDLLPDPQHAVKSLAVGDFYMKKGDIDAAIDRYEEAARLNPKMARTYLLLGEAYEKKNDVAGALTAYRKYLDVNHAAPDKDKILKRIERLEGKASG